MCWMHLSGRWIYIIYFMYGNMNIYNIYMDDEKKIYIFLYSNFQINSLSHPKPSEGPQGPSFLDQLNSQDRKAGQWG